jgi:opacity protein-like surface antigen
MRKFQVILVCLLGFAPAAPAGAEWFIVPFTGASFGSDTNYVDLDLAAGRTNVAFGVSAGLLGPGFLGVEVDIGTTPGFFERESPELVTSSSVTTIMGNLIITAPLSITRESLRPYLVAGMGLLHSSSDDLAEALSFKRDLLGFTVGGGVTGYFNNSVGVRLDLRYLRHVNEDESPGVGLGPTRLSLWRASVGIALRY